MIPPRTENAPEYTLPATAKPTRDIAAARELAAERAMGFQVIGQFVFEFSQLDFTIRLGSQRNSQADPKMLLIKKTPRSG